MARQQQLRIAAPANLSLQRFAELIAPALQLQLQRYAAAPAEPCYELHTCRGGAKITTSHRMMFFCRTFGALVPSERQGCQHQGGQRDGDHGRRAQLKRQPRVRGRRVLMIEINENNLEIY